MSEPAAFTPADMVAASSLSVNVPPEAAAELLRPGSTRDTCMRLLAEIPPPGVTLWEVVAEDVAAESPLGQLYGAVRQLPGVGRTIGSKLLAAKRPALVPIRDSKVEKFVGAGDAWWLPMRALVSDPRVRDAIAAVSQRVVPDDVTLLRRLDVILWNAADQSS